MHRTRVNECVIGLKIKTQGPFSVLEGRYRKDKINHRKKVIVGRNVLILRVNNRQGFEDFPDNIPVSRSTDDVILRSLSNITRDDPAGSLNELDYYVPGASLRGALRSYAEKIMRTLDSGTGRLLSCNPFEEERDKRDLFCGKRLENQKGRGVYREQCPVCALFGSTAVAARIRIGDFILEDRGSITVRDGIAINRFSGGVARGPFRSLLLEGYTFRGRIHIRNFELWQLGLLAFCLCDFCRGLIPIGWGKSKGYGSVTGEVTGVTFSYYGSSGLSENSKIEGIEHRGFDEDALLTGMKKMDVGDGLVQDPDTNRPFVFGYAIRGDRLGSDLTFWRTMTEYFMGAVEKFNQPVEQTAS